MVVVLPLEPVIGQDLALQKARCQFQFADNGQPEAAHLGQFGRVQGNAGADHDEVLAAKGQQPVTAGLDVDAFFEQRGNVFGQRFGAANVGDRNLGAATAQKNAAARPDFPSPTTRTFLPLSSIIDLPQDLVRGLLYSAPHRQRANSLLSSLRRQSHVGSSTVD